MGNRVVLGLIGTTLIVLLLLFVFRDGGDVGPENPGPGTKRAANDTSKVLPLPPSPLTHEQIIRTELLAAGWREAAVN